ncbi:MAG: TVP38/TMEM64 family protein, partial [Vicinamibacterales bacterium]
MNKTRAALSSLVALAVAAFFLLDGGAVLSLGYFESQRGLLEQYRAAHPGATAALYFLGYVVVAALSLPGAAVMTLAGGAVFGFWQGLLLASFASTLGATLAFLVTRFLFRDWVQSRFGRRLRSVNEGVEREGPFYLFALRLVPLFPFWLVNLAMGLTPLG